MRSVWMPSSLEELWRVLEASPGVAVYAGGTDLLVRMRSGAVSPSGLICIERIPELKGVEVVGESLRIGSGTTHASLLADPISSRHLPVLTQALKMLGSPLIRNMGTIGGNVCTASPAGDTLPPLHVLKASVELLSKGGSRTLPIEEFIEGPGLTRLEEGEILAAVRMPKPAPGAVQHFEKVGLRNALACALVSLAAIVRLSPEGIVEDAALAWGSVGATVVRCPRSEEHTSELPEAEALLRDRRLDVDALSEAASVVRKTVSPISDVRAGADYRRVVAGNLLLRLAPSKGQERTALAR